MSLIPRDLSHFLNGDHAQRSSFASSLLDDFSRTGFAKIVNSGFTRDEVNALFNMSRSFFAQPVASKLAISHTPGPNPQRGWSAVGAENASRLYLSEFAREQNSKDQLDCREHFDMGAPEDTEYRNKWPTEDLPSFQTVMELYFHRFAEVSVQILDALEFALEIPPGSLTRNVSNNASEFRLLRYPEIDVATLKGGRINRIWPHFDLGVITLLFQDGSGGLEIQDRTNLDLFMPILPGQSVELITNVSETLQRWTNNKVPAGLHQVTVPYHLKNEEEGTVGERYSIAFFCKADRNACVGSMAPFVTAANPAAYTDMTAIEYQKLRLESAY